MNYNARPATGALGARKVKRVSDVNAMGGPPVGVSPPPPQPPVYVADPFASPMPNNGSGFGPSPTSSFGGPQMAAPFNGNYSAGYAMPQQQQHPHSAPSPHPYQQPQPQMPSPAFAMPMPQQQQQQQQQQQSMFAPQSAPGQPQIFDPAAGLGMFQQPIVQDMAIQYGQSLANQGKQLVESHFEKYVPIAHLKYYFAVDNNYVINKLRLLVFPFTHTNWTLRYNEDSPVQPRYDLNAPDLYLPVMAYITYVVLAGFVLGMQDKFTPEDLGKQSSSALIVLLLEVLVYNVVLYVTQIPTTLKSLDLVAYAGYKYVTMNACIGIGMLFHGFGYWLALVYGNVALAFFLTRTLYTKLKSGPVHAESPAAAAYDAYGQPIPAQYSVPHQQPQHDFGAARKRKLYFTGFLVVVQMLVTWWMTRSLIAPSPEQVAAL